MGDPEMTLEGFVQHEASGLPLPGSGETWKRFQILADWSSFDLSLGRLVEGHSDALAVIAEAGMKPAGESLKYGVWAARSSRGGARAALRRSDQITR